jgi:hypothetical protein
MGGGIYPLLRHEGFWRRKVSPVFLLLMIPMPTLLLGPTVGALQRASAGVTHVLFRFAGVPVDWLGLGFTLRGPHFETAKECSGIHSTLIRWDRDQARQL